MAGYRRFIAYVYEYQKGKKGSNCGFIKVEVREQRCSVEVHLHCVGITPQTECRVYGFVRKDGLMNGILLGTCETEDDVVECLIETDSLSMADSGIALGKMGGMVLLTQSGGFFGTEWDDQPIRPDNFRELRMSELPEKREISGLMDASDSSMSSNETPMPDAEAKNEEMVNDDAKIDNVDADAISDTEVEKQSTDTNEKQTVSDQSAFLENAVKPQSDVQSQSEKEIPGPEDMPVKKESEQMPEEEPIQQMSTSYLESAASANEPTRKESAAPANEPTRKESAAPANMPTRKESAAPANEPIRKESAAPANMSTRSEPAAAPANEQATRERATPPRDETPCESVRRPPRNPAEFRRLSFGEEFMPFDDGEFLRSWRIKPGDLVHFPPRNRSLSGNRFVQYGYYNFGHLLLAHKPGGQFVLGVPGGYDQQERFMAGMFGFPYFKASRQIELPKCKGGYWYRLIDSPNLN